MILNKVDIKQIKWVFLYLWKKTGIEKKKTTTTATTTKPYDMAITTTKILQDYLPFLSEEIKFQCKQYYSV